MIKEIGMNLILDVYKVDERFLNSKKFLLNLIDDIVKILKVEKVGKSIIKKISSDKYKFAGYSIIQIISESHIALHAWPEYKYLAIDIFSCKKFNERKLIDYLKSSLKTNKIKTKKIKREAVI